MDAAVGIRQNEPVLRLSTEVSTEEPLFPVKYRDRLCYIDRTGALVIQTEFESGERFHGDRAIVRSERRRWVIDRAGQIVFESQWRDIKPYHEGFAAVRQVDAWGFVDRDGRIVVDPQYSSVTRFSEGLAGVEIGRTTLAITRSATLDRPGRRGFIDGAGTIVIPIVYEDVQPFSQDRAVVCLTSILKPNPLVGGRELPSDRKYGLMDRTGRIIIDGIYSGISPFREGLAAVHTGQLMRRDRWGYIDTMGNVAVPLRLRSAGNFDYGLALVKRRGHHHRQLSSLIDRTGRLQFETRMQLSWDGFKEGLAAACFDRDWGVIDSTGQTVVEPQFDDISSFNHGVAAVSRGEWFGYIDTSGQFTWGPTTGSIISGRTIEGEWYQ